MALPRDDEPNDADSDGRNDKSAIRRRNWAPSWEQTDASDSASKLDFRIVARPEDGGPLNEKWFVSYWRPSMAWLYMLVVAFDFIIAPVMSMIIPILPFVKNMTYTPWHPLTLEGGGLIHVTFGAVLGITAWGRTKEKTSDTSDAFGG